MKMLGAGEGMTAVAKALGVSRQSIYRIKNEVKA
jgi:DNA-binding phage protein